MSNSVADLERDSYIALDVVSRELSGMILACTRDSSADALAIGEVARAPVAPDAGEMEDFAPSMSIPAAADETIGNVGVQITNQKVSTPFSWSGEEQYSMDKTGPGFLTVKQQQIYQRMRKAVNSIELDGFTQAYKRASRAYGTAGTTPFATAGDWSDLSQGVRILLENGTPQDDLQGVLSLAAGANIKGKQSQLQMSGDRNLLMQGVLDTRLGVALRESAQAVTHTKGTGTSYALNLVAGYPVGSTAFALDTGSGTVLAGDVLTNSQSGRDANNKYIVRTALSAGALTLNNPGNRVAWVDNDTVAVGNSYTANLVFARGAIALATRVPKIEKDLADEVVIVTDPATGLSFMIRHYPGYGMGVYKLFINWGWSVIKSEWMAIILG